MSSGDKVLTEERKNNIRDNITIILLYSLAMATALGFNELVLSIFRSFRWSGKHIITKTIYVVSMFSITVFLAYYLGHQLNIG